VSSGDRAALGRKMLDPQITRMARDQQLSLEEATARLFKERFPQQPVPETTEAMLAALAENEAALPSEIKDLAAQRLKAVYDGIKKAGIDGKRLKEDATPAMSGARAGQVKLDLVAPESPGPAERPNFFKRLLGRAKREPSPVRE
jgi:hypothetical protein